MIRFAVAISLAGFVLISGCAPEEPITTQFIPKDQSGLEALRPGSDDMMATAAAASPSVPTRMMVALFSRKDATWFFKVTGPAEKLDSLADDLPSFFSSVTFPAGDPEYVVPESWQQGPAKPMRFATFIIEPGDPPVELAISSLSAEQDLLLNVNRWRQQIGLPAIAATSLDQEFPLFPNNGEPFHLFDATGSGSGQMGSAPFANAPFANAPFATAGNPPVPPTGAPSAEEIQFQVPEGWQAGPTSAMVQARLSKSVGDAEAQITIVKMPAAANEWEPNVQRWAGQIDVQLDSATIASQSREIQIGQQPGQWIELIGQQAEAPQGIIAAMVKQGDSAWFLKLAGPADLVRENTATFESFLESIKF